MKSHDKIINILWKYPGLCRERLQGIPRNMFHEAFMYAVIKNSKRDKADVRVLKMLIEHDLKYCSKHEGANPLKSFAEPF